MSFLSSTGQCHHLDFEASDENVVRLIYPCSLAFPVVTFTCCMTLTTAGGTDLATCDKLVIVLWITINTCWLAFSSHVLYVWRYTTMKLSLHCFLLDYIIQALQSVFLYCWLDVMKCSWSVRSLAVAVIRINLGGSMGNGMTVETWAS